MKTKIGILFLSICSTFLNMQAQRVNTTTRAMSYDISDNLDLEAVASLFGDSKNLEDFEMMLNDQDTRISNLDLNEDGYIDYLRVIENSSEYNSLVVIQAVLDENIYQDVATIEVERTNNSNHRIQIVGNSYLYGSDYIIEPLYRRTPLIFSFFWGPRYTIWHSPYHWNYYPSSYRYYRPYSPFKYQRYVHAHINYHNKYRHSSSRNFNFQEERYNQIRRNDYASRYPDRSFDHRNQGLKNKYELNSKRPDQNVSRQKSAVINQPNNRQVETNRNSNSGRNERQRTVNESRRPAAANQSVTNQNRTRENNQARPSSNNSKVQQNKPSGNSSISKPEVNRSQPTTRPNQERTRSRVEPTKKSAVNIGTSASKSTPARSRNAVRPSQNSAKKSAPANRNQKNETSKRRRTE